MGLSQLIKFLLPMILWFSWVRPAINDTTSNLWFLYAWKTLCYGYIISYGLTSIMWLFSFTDNLNVVKVYIGAWLVFATFGGAFMFISILAYLFVAIGKYVTDTYFSVGEIWLTLFVYMIISIPDIYLTRRFAWNSILWLIGS